WADYHSERMSSSSASAIPASKTTLTSGPMPHGDLSVVRRLLPYLWEYRGRVLLALALLVSAKLANIAVPLVMKRIVDGLSEPAAIAAIPVALLVSYGLLRLSSTLFNELRDVVFVKVAQRSMRRIALEVF